MYFYSLIIIGY